MALAPIGKLFPPMIGVGSRLVAFGYYGDPATFESSATSALSTRLRLLGSRRGDFITHEGPGPRDDGGIPEGWATRERYGVDHVIVGKQRSRRGPRLRDSEARGRSILRAERGQHVDPRP